MKEHTENEKNNGFGVASLVCGILGIFMVPFVLSILAIIFGGIAIHKKQKYGIAGLVLGIIGVVIDLILTVVLLVFFVGVFSAVLNKYLSLMF